MRFLPRRWGRSTPPTAGEPARCFTEEDVVALAELLYAERVRRATPPPENQPTKFRPVVIASDLRLCYAQKEIDGVKRRVQVPCP